MLTHKLALMVVAAALSTQALAQDRTIFPTGEKAATDPPALANRLFHWCSGRWLTHFTKQRASGFIANQFIVRLLSEFEHGQT